MKLRDQDALEASNSFDFQRNSNTNRRDKKEILTIVTLFMKKVPVTWTQTQLLQISHLTRSHQCNLFSKRKLKDTTGTTQGLIFNINILNHGNQTTLVEWHIQ